MYNTLKLYRVYNPHAVAFCVEQPLAITREKFSNGKVVVLGRLLQRLGVPSKKSNRRTLYYLSKGGR